MKKISQLVLVAAVMIAPGIRAQAPMLLRGGVQRLAYANESSGNPTNSGIVTDADGNPLSGATVEFWRAGENPFLANALELKKQLITETNGAFEFQELGAVGFLVARKPGLAPAWKQLGQSFGMMRVMDEKLQLVLAPPAGLAGTVVDEAGKPVVNAGVSVGMAVSEISSAVPMRTFNFITGKPARDCFAARTDAAGHFRIENFPTNAAATLVVQFSGKALSQLSQPFTRPGSLPWQAGQEDIKLVLEPAGGIEGKIVVEGGRQPPPGAQLTLQPGGPAFFATGGNEPVQSGPDGTFRFNDVAAGAYHVRAVFGTNGVSEWVAELAPVTVEAGQTAQGVVVTASHGGLLEVAVLGKNDLKPLPQVMVNAFSKDFQTAANSDSDGIARLRLLPGDYQVMAFRQSLPGGQTSASVGAGQTNRVELEIAAPKKISGIVRQLDGRPAAGLPVVIVSGFGPNLADAKTDAAGRFKVELNLPAQFGANNLGVCLLFRDAEHNLVAAQDVSDEDTGPLDLKLAPGLTLVGRVVSDGRPVTNATATLMFWTENRGTWLPGLARTNTPGQFEIPALPPGRKYGVIVSAPGYGQKQISDVGASAEAIRQQLDPVELNPARLKLAGQVLDEGDKPVAGVYVNLSGEGQPSANTKTDREGRFLFGQVCEGQAQLSANGQGSFGNISAEGGDTNVVLRLGQNYNGSPGATLHKLKGTVADPAGRPVAGAQVAVFPANGSRNWVRTATNGSFSLTWSLQPWQLQQEGAQLVVRDLARNLAATEDLSEDITNLDAVLKPALSISGLVKSGDGSPLAGAQLNLMIKAGNSYQSVDDQMFFADAQGRFEFKCLPPAAEYFVNATAKGHGSLQQQVKSDAETNRLELSPFILKVADQGLAGQVLDEDDKPVSGVNVSFNGNGQPNGNMITDSKGRFHFQVCEGQVQLSANGQNLFGSNTADAGDTNVVLRLGQNYNNSPGTKLYKLKGTVSDSAGLPVIGARVAVFPSNGSRHWVRTGTNGAFNLTWSLQPWQLQQGGGGRLVVRDPARNLAATEDLSEDISNLDVVLKPALSLSGLVKNSDGSPLAGAQVYVQFKAGNSYEQLDEQSPMTDAQGRYENKCLPPEAEYLVYVTAKGHGSRQQPIQSDPENSRMEIPPFVLKPADRMLAGQVLDEDDKPVSGANVSLNGNGQPNGNMVTDSKGRFHFQVCEGQVQISANGRNTYGNITAEGGDTNVVLQLGQQYNGGPGTKIHRLRGTVADPDGQPVIGARVAVFPSSGPNNWKKTTVNGAFSLTWTLQSWQLQQGQGSSAMLVARDIAHNLAATEALPEGTTNLDIMVKPGLTLAGRVEDADGTALPNAQIIMFIKTGNSYGQMEEQMIVTDARGYYEVKGLPQGAQYLASVSAPGHGGKQQPVQNFSDTNRLELPPFVLKPADQVLAGQVKDVNDRPLAGVNVSLNGNGQPNGNMMTDSKGRFHFQVCDGQVQLFASSQAGFAQGTASAGDTNVVLTLRVQPGGVRPAPRHGTLKGKPLSDLTTVNLASADAPAGQPVLLCLFDVGQSLSRRVIHQVDRQAAALRNKNVAVVGIQAVVTSDDTFNEWKSNSLVSFPIGRVAVQSDKSKWASSVPTLPWLILADAGHRVIAEGFVIEDLDAEVGKLAK